MRAADPTARADTAQGAAADTGLKGMIPTAGGRPFLEYVVSALADAGVTDVCVVIGPEHNAVRTHFELGVIVTRVTMHFAIQQEARGTADAMLAVEPFAADDLVLVVNADNYYPVHTLMALRQLGGAGVAAFEREALVNRGNIEAERVLRYSVIEADENGMLRRIVEKPEAAYVASMHGEVFVGMNSWSLPPDIYEACRRVTPSPRGELELPQAVQIAHDELGVAFRVLRFHDGVLDLSARGDIASVTERLRNVVPRL